MGRPDHCCGAAPLGAILAPELTFSALCAILAPFSQELDAHSAHKDSNTRGVAMTAARREIEKRLVARAKPEIHQRIAEAAELQGSTVSQFLLDAALERATEITERATRISTSREAFENMMVALDQPKRQLPRLRKAAKRYKDLVHASDKERAT
jgi:uncharacterized protein (DUF1778 family)